MMQPQQQRMHQELTRRQSPLLLALLMMLTTALTGHWRGPTHIGAGIGWWSSV